MNKLSKIFRPFHREKALGSNLRVNQETKTDSKGYELLRNYGFIQRSSSGMYHLLPMGYKSIQKLTNLVDYHMLSIGAQKMSLCMLTSQSLWKKAETYEKAKDDLYMLTDKNGNNLILSPTYEEAFTDFLSGVQLSYKNLPLMFYQISSKFRDEKHPKLGLLRSKEFIMKDLYSFDLDQENSRKSYEKVSSSYSKFFDTLNIPIFRYSNEKEPGVSESHEYFFFSKHGDDKIYHCEKCNTVSAAKIYESSQLCVNCSFKVMESGFTNAIEVAHTFNYGTSYSDRMKCNYVSKEGTKKSAHLCSYGIGISRILAASVEILSIENELRLPPCIAPYTVCLIPPKGGCRDEIIVELLLPELYEFLESIPTLKNDVIVDDRSQFSIGQRLIEAKGFGFPFIIIAGKDATRNLPLFELHDTYNEKKFLMPRTTLLQYLIDNTKHMNAVKVEKEYIK